MENKVNWDKIHTLYFIGIGGIGMSALARYFLNLGKEVHGYDLTPTPLTHALEKEGVQIHYQDDPGKIPGEVDMAIYTPAIPVENTELQWIRSHQIPLYKRAEVIGMLTKGHFSIAIGGTHGKTSISAIAAHILHSAGLPVTAFVGGIMKNYNSNILLSAPTEYFLVEADEYDRSFLQLHPEIGLISSMDADHLDIYGQHEHLKKGFELFAGQISEKGILIYNDTLQISHSAANSLSYGLGPGANIRASNIRIEEGHFVFDLTHRQGEIKNIRMEIPGKHYVENATAAAAIAHCLWVEDEQIKEGLESFRGVERRFEFIINTPELVYIDDYAHHPEEIKATLDTLDMLYPGRKKAGIFQPHLYSRTRDLADEFAHTLNTLDEIILLPIYPAREKPLPGITSEWLLDKIENPNKILVPKADLINYLNGRDIDVLITLGAGDIGLMSRNIQTLLEKK
ncbi:MAG: UDP-N-acetylmuramate--L-alanine ligase [bacterium]